jgi:hypothetical protein
MPDAQPRLDADLDTHALTVAVKDFEQTIGDLNLVIGVDAEQVGVEGGMMDFGSGRGLWSRTGRGTAPRARQLDHLPDDPL